MIRWHCPLCHRTHETSDEIVRVHHVCAASQGELAEMTAKTWELYCGNIDCPTRSLGYTFHASESEIPDGALWFCPDCREQPARVVDVETELV